MNAIEPNQSPRQGYVVALLNLPPRTVLGLDGQSVVLKRDDFVGVTGVPQDTAFHLVTVRAGSAAKTTGVPNQDGAAAVTVAFSFSTESSQALVRKYDPLTEEVSSSPVDQATAENLLNEIRARRIDLQRTVSYEQLIPAAKSSEWRDLTRFVASSLLQRRGIFNGGKIVPGAYGFDDDVDSDKPLSRPHEPSNDESVDGKAVTYPRIPVMDSSQSARTHSRHVGTKHFVANLSPAQRTSLFLEPNPGDRVLGCVLSSYYDNQWKDMLGDVQLSYALFLHLHCFSSLEHWRDLVAMFSVVELQGISSRVEIYSELLSVLSRQIKSMERDFFDDVEMSGDNSLVPALQRLLVTLSRVSGGDTLTDALSKIKALLVDRFPKSFTSLLAGDDTGGVDTTDSMRVDSDDEDDEDGPVMVSTADVEASFARTDPLQRHVSETYPESLRQQFPLIFAAMMPHEDVLMTCARALDNASDVSLVREAAAYLQQVENQ